MKNPLLLHDLLYIGEHQTCNHYRADVGSGFIYEELEAGETERLDTVRRNHLLILLEGRCSLDCNQFSGRDFSAGEMILVPRSAAFSGRTLTRVRLLDMAFEKPESGCDRLVLQSYHTLCRQLRYDFRPTEIRYPLTAFFDLLVFCLKNGMSCAHLHEMKHRELFFYLRGFYSKEEIAASGLAYLALGHIHKRAEPLTFGGTVCAWPGCPEGRGFDELGEKGFYSGTIDDSGKVSLTFVPFARRRYEILTVDVTDQDPRAAIEAALPADTAQDLYRILLTGETGEGGVHTDALKAALADRFYALELRDRTRLAEDLWAKAKEDSLRGLFLRDLKQQLAQAQTEEDRQRVTMAARFGLAALDHRDLG